LYNFYCLTLWRNKLTFYLAPLSCYRAVSVKLPSLTRGIVNVLLKYSDKSYTAENWILLTTFLSQTRWVYLKPSTDKQTNRQTRLPLAIARSTIVRS